MDLSNVKVKHKTFGIGTIIEFDNKYLTVQFEGKISKFVYPDAFEKFIEAEDPKIQKIIITNIISKKHSEEEKRRAELLARKFEEERNKQTAEAGNKTRNIEEGFGKDYNVQHLARKPILTYQEVEKQFDIRIAGFGKGINVTPSSVVLISSVDKKKSGFVYHDRWTADGDYIYSGEGKNGDQKMTSGNRAIKNAAVEGKTIYLFVKFSPQEYYYQGVFELKDFTYEDDIDENGDTRKEYKFRLRKVNRGENS